MTDNLNRNLETSVGRDKFRKLVETVLDQEVQELEVLKSRVQSLQHQVSVLKSIIDELSDVDKVEKRVKSRADGRYFAGISYRITDKQKALIAFAVDEVHMSRQEMIEHLLMPWLEEQVGEKFDELHPDGRYESKK